MSEPENEKTTLEETLQKPKLEDADTLIVSNIFAQVPIALVMVALFLWCRKKAPWVYFPNSRKSPYHPGFNKSGVFDWISPIISIQDIKLLGIIGLDGFMFLQTIKLLCRICGILSVVVAPIMCILYRNANVNSQTGGSPEKRNIFLMFTIKSIKSFSIDVTILLMSYFVTIVVCYLIYIYYKRYICLRQMYLASPASMTSIVKLKQITQNLPEDQTGIEFIDIKTRAVLMSRLPSAIVTDYDCYEYVKTLGIGEVESVSLVKDTYRLQKLYGERDAIVQNIEKEVDVAVRAMKRYFDKYPKEAQEAFGVDSYKDFIKIINEYRDEQFYYEEKSDLGNFFSLHANYFLRKKGEITYLRFYMNELEECIAQIEKEKMQIKATYSKENSTIVKSSPSENDDDKSSEDDNESRLVVNSPREIVNIDQNLFLEADYNDISFFSLKQVLNLHKNRKMFSLDLPIGQQRAIVVFKDQRSAAIAIESKIGTAMFSTNAIAAPAPNDIIWANLHRNEIVTNILKILSLAVFIFLNFIFLKFLYMLVSTLKHTDDSPNWILASLIRRNDWVFKFYQGIIAPLIYNIMLFFVPIVIEMLLNVEGIMAFSFFQIKMMDFFSFFLFINGFLALCFTQSIVTLILDLSTNGKTMVETAESLTSNLMSSSLFFFNSILQRLFVGTMMVFLKPGPFIFNFIVTPFIKKTRRQKQELEFSPPINFGNAIPNALLIFPMVLTYTCIVPLMLPLGWVFYLFNSFAYKNELLYASKNEYESGGIYWMSATRFIMYSLIVFQVATAAQIYAHNSVSLSSAMIPLIFLTCWFIYGMGRVFSRSCMAYPINTPEKEYLDEFSVNAVRERKQLICEWKENKDEDDEDVLPLKETEIKVDRRPTGFYDSPTLGQSIVEIILPKDFYKMIYYIRNNDEKNFFKFK
ncbi:calcium permeable stress-gated cation channel [Enteropsectra breve]|nr:calcium permeable stress-gated cation channel [Enteropsectra breve]